VTFAEVFNMTFTPDIATLDRMAGLDFSTPFDELTELREVLTTQQIAEFTGLRRETISRARRDKPFRPRTERAIGDLYLVVTRMRSLPGLDLRHLAAILRRPQAALGGRSIGELLKDGKVDLVLHHLAGEGGGLRPPTPSSAGAVEALLAADPELAGLLPEIEARLREHFAPVDSIARGVSVEHEGEGDDELVLQVKNDLSFGQNFDRLAAFLEQERNLLAPVRTRLTIGFM
jgi:hypothetical protein